MEKLRSPKVCAALVMILWLATLVAFWGMTAAGRAAIAGDASCSPQDIQNKSLQLEMVSSAKQALEVLNVSGKEPCIRRSVAAQVRADYLFIPGYSLLGLALFLFAGSLRNARAWTWALLAIGLLLAAVMAFGDVRENLELERIVDAAGQNPPREDLIQPRLLPLQQFAFLKMGAVALAAFLLGALWRSRSGSWLVWAPRLLGIMAGALFVGAMVVSQQPGETRPEDWELAALGMMVFSLFAFAALVHALAVAITVEPLEGDTRT